MYALFHCMIKFIVIPLIIGLQRYIIHYKSQRNFITFFIMLLTFKERFTDKGCGLTRTGGKNRHQVWMLPCQ